MIDVLSIRLTEDERAVVVTVVAILYVSMLFLSIARLIKRIVDFHRHSQRIPELAFRDLCFMGGQGIAVTAVMVASALSLSDLRGVVFWMVLTLVPPLLGMTVWFVFEFFRIER